MNFKSNQHKYYCLVVGHETKEVIGACIIQVCQSGTRKCCLLCIEQKIHQNDVNFSVDDIMLNQDIEKLILQNHKEYGSKLDDLFSDYYFQYLFVLDQNQLTQEIQKELEKVYQQLLLYIEIRKEIQFDKYIKQLTEHNQGLNQYLEVHKNKLNAISDNLLIKLKLLITEPKRNGQILLLEQKKKIDVLTNIQTRKKYQEKRFTPQELEIINRNIQEFQNEHLKYAQSMSNKIKKEKIQVLDKIIQVNNNFQPALKEKGRVMSKILRNAQKRQQMQDTNQQEQLTKNQQLNYYEDPNIFFDAGIQLQPLDDDIFYQKGLALKRQNNFDDSLLAFKKAIEINPNNSDYYMQLGKLFEKQQKYDEAIAQFTNGIQINPKCIQLYFNKAEILYQQSKLEEAILVYQQALKFAPEDIVLHHKLGLLYHKSEKHEETILICDKIIEMFPQHLIQKYKKQQSQIYIKQARKKSNERKEKKKKQYWEFVKHQKYHPSCHYSYYVLFYKLKGLALSKLGKHEEAFYNYNQALVTFFEKKVFYRLKGMELIKLQRYEEALACFNLSITNFPNQNFFYIKKVETLLYLSHFEDALQLSEQCIILFPNQTNLFQLLVQISQKSSKYDETISLIQNALTNQPDDQRIQDLKICLEIIKYQIIGYYQNKYDQPQQIEQIIQPQENSDQTDEQESNIIVSKNKKIIKIQGNLKMNQKQEITPASFTQPISQFEEEKVDLLNSNPLLQPNESPNVDFQGVCTQDQMKISKTKTTNIQIMTHKHYCQQGKALFEKKEYSQALIKFEKAVQMKPELYKQTYDKEQLLRSIDQNESLQYFFNFVCQSLSQYEQ